MCTLISILIVFHPANDPLSYSIVEGDGTPVPRPLLSVVASDLDGDTITYAINPASVSMIRLRPDSEYNASKQCILDAVPKKCNGRIDFYPTVALLWTCVVCLCHSSILNWALAMDGMINTRELWPLAKDYAFRCNSYKLKMQSIETKLLVKVAHLKHLTLLQYSYSQQWTAVAPCHKYWYSIEVLHIKTFKYCPLISVVIFHHWCCHWWCSAKCFAGLWDQHSTLSEDNSLWSSSQLRVSTTMYIFSILRYCYVLLLCMVWKP